jgi:hypothetical protein
MRGTRKELLLFYHIIILMIFFHRKYAVTFENAFSWQAPFSPMRWLYDLEEGQEESEAREREGGRERERETHGSSSLSLSLFPLSLFTAPQVQRRTVGKDKDGDTTDG